MQNLSYNQNAQTAYEAKCARKQSEARKLQSENAHLVPASNNARNYVTAAKNIRIELKRAFPKCKFSVTSESFAGGDAVRIDWTDGPTVAQVETISGKYEAGNFDGMQDLYTYSHEAWNEAFGDAKYITTSRHLSDAFVSSVLATFSGTFDGDAVPTLEDYHEGRMHYNAWNRTIRLALCDTSA